mmetsp:Transcript_4154/g.10504  ORF Transcript_4154/g.10504 Transcript_4154/m.10504 type:complete len:890 (-) Transcript_4154:1569-4238(-)
MAAASAVQGATVVVRTSPHDRFSRETFRIDPKAATIAVHINKRNPEQFINHQREDWEFSFDRVLHNRTQADVFADCGERAVHDAIRGINQTIMAFGRAGTGQEHTIFGASEKFEHRGLAPRALTLLFEEMDKRGGTAFNVRLSVVEVYNNRLHDLLAPLSKREVDLAISDVADVVAVKELTLRSVATEADALAALFDGLAAREATGRDSSRSHCIATVQIGAFSPTNEVTPRTVGKLTFVDLAGSTRLSPQAALTQQEVRQVTEPTEAEIRHINLSLSCLERVIVTATSNPKAFLPYRQSKLTHFLRDSLGVNAATTMIATISADAHLAEYTVATLRLAQRMRGVVAVAEPQIEITEADTIKQLKDQIDLLTQELKMRDTMERRREHAPTTPLTPLERHEVNTLVTKYVDRQIDKIPVSGMRQVNALFTAFRDVILSQKTEVARVATLETELAQAKKEAAEAVAAADKAQAAADKASKAARESEPPAPSKPIGRKGSFMAAAAMVAAASKKDKKEKEGGARGASAGGAALMAAVGIGKLTGGGASVGTADADGPRMFGKGKKPKSARRERPLGTPESAAHELYLQAVAVLVEGLKKGEDGVAAVIEAASDDQKDVMIRAEDIGRISTDIFGPEGDKGGSPFGDKVRGLAAEGFVAVRLGDLGYKLGPRRKPAVDISGHSREEMYELFKRTTGKKYASILDANNKALHSHRVASRGLAIRLNQLKSGIDRVDQEKRQIESYFSDHSPVHTGGAAVVDEPGLKLHEELMSLKHDYRDAHTEYSDHQREIGVINEKNINCRRKMLKMFEEWLDLEQEATASGGSLNSSGSTRNGTSPSAVLFETVRLNSRRTSSATSSARRASPGRRVQYSAGTGSTATLDPTQQLPRLAFV